MFIILRIIMRICGPHFYQGEEKVPLKLLPFSSTILPYADTYSHYGAKHVGYPYRKPMLYVFLCSGVKSILNCTSVKVKK